MLGSVRGVVSNDHSYRDKDQTAQGPRGFIRSKATCAAPLCEVLTPCRGQRPHHVQRDRIGTWEVSGLDRRCTRLNSSHTWISYNLFRLSTETRSQTSS